MSELHRAPTCRPGALHFQEASGVVRPIQHSMALCARLSISAGGSCPVNVGRVSSRWDHAFDS